MYNYNFWNKLVLKLAVLVLAIVVIAPVSGLAKINLGDRNKLFMAIEDRNLVEIDILVTAGISLDPRAYYHSKPLHKAIETKDLRVVQTVLELSRTVINFQNNCLVDAYAYAGQRYTYLQRMAQGSSESLVCKEDAEIFLYLERELSKLGVTVDYRAFRVYIPIRDSDDEHKYYKLRSKPYYDRDGSVLDDISAVAALNLDGLQLDDQANTRRKLENWSGCEVHIAKISTADEPGMGSTRVCNVSVGKKVLEAQKLRPKRSVSDLVVNPGAQKAAVVQDVLPARQLSMRSIIYYVIAISAVSYALYKFRIK